MAKRRKLQNIRNSIIVIFVNDLRIDRFIAISKNKKSILTNRNYREQLFSLNYEPLTMR
jgi:hypothetical protein